VGWVEFGLWDLVFYHAKGMWVVFASAALTQFEVPVMVYQMGFMELRRPRGITCFDTSLIGFD